MHTRIAAAAFFLLAGLSEPGVAFAQTSLESLARRASIDATEPRSAAVAAASPTAAAESSAQTAADPDDMKVSVYPILVWVPAFTARTTVPAFPDLPDGPDLPGGSGSTSTSLDGAALAGVTLEKANWRLDFDGIWAALVTQRDRPLLNVDLDLLYGHVSGGVKIYKDLYVTGGVRRVALQYDIQLADRPQHFIRKPGIWDPLIGFAWHSGLESRWILRIAAAGGGFGVGADVDLSASVRADLKFFKHFGLTLGYAGLYLKLSDTERGRTFEVEQTLHGPTVGLGLYF